MNIYIELLLVAVTVIFIVDISGFSDKVLDVASHIKGRRIDQLRPFTCSLCMTWWVTLIWAIIQGQLSIPIIAYCAALAAFSFPIGQIFIFITEGLNKLIATLSNLLKL